MNTKVGDGADTWWRNIGSALKRKNCEILLRTTLLKCETI